MGNDLEILRASSAKIQESIRHQCMTSAGGIDSKILCSSLSLLDPREVITNRATDTLDKVMKHLHRDKVGCVTIIDDDGRIIGIFSERDYIIKVYGNDADHADPISEFMTPDPICVKFDDTIAYALTLMSQGGFRHLPVIDNDDQPVGIISVKCIVDFLSGKIFSELLDGGQV